MSKSPFADFTSTHRDLPQYCQMLVDFPPCNCWIHETKLSEHLHLPPGARSAHMDEISLTAKPLEPTERMIQYLGALIRMECDWSPSAVLDPWPQPTGERH